MVSRTLGFPATQCGTAQLVYPAANCCPVPPPPTTCDKTGWPPFKKLGFDSCRTNKTALSYERLAYEIGVKGRPVAFSWEWVNSDGSRSGKGHMMVAGGYTKSNGVNMVEIYDPLCRDTTTPDPAHPCGYILIPYSLYVQGSLLNGTDYAHWDDFYEIHRP